DAPELNLCAPAAEEPCAESWNDAYPGLRDVACRAVGSQWPLQALANAGSSTSARCPPSERGSSSLQAWSEVRKSKRVSAATLVHVVMGCSTVAVRRRDRFPNDKSELAFVAGRARQSLRNCAVACTLFQVSLAFALFQGGFRGLDHEDHQAVRAVYVMKVVAIGLFAIPSLAICLGFSNKLGAVGSERLVSIMCLCGCLTVILSKPSYMALLQGHDPSNLVGATWRRGEAETALTCLMLDTVLTVSHLYLRVRWYYLLAADSTVLLPI
ncbi:unnamed protein product, partial [Prorocentrum cordatum]